MKEGERHSVNSTLHKHSNILLDFFQSQLSAAEYIHARPACPGIQAA